MQLGAEAYYLNMINASVTRLTLNRLQSLIMKQAIKQTNERLKVNAPVKTYQFTYYENINDETKMHKTFLSLVSSKKMPLNV